MPAVSGGRPYSAAARDTTESVMEELNFRTNHRHFGSVASSPDHARTLTLPAANQKEGTKQRCSVSDKQQARHATAAYCSGRPGSRTQFQALAREGFNACRIHSAAHPGCLPRVDTPFSQRRLRSSRGWSDPKQHARLELTVWPSVQCNADCIQL